MLILGEISGIQTFVYDVSHQGGGQARRLRPRSFYVQALSEAAAIVTLQRLTEHGWTFDLSQHLLVSAAGRFLLRGPAVTGATWHVQQIERDLSRWLLDHLSGELRVSLAVTRETGTEVEQFAQLRTEELDKSRLSPWGPALAIVNGCWQPDQLILPPLDTPCTSCRKRPGTVTELDQDTQESRLVCQLCDQQLELGKSLPRANWLAFASTPRDTDVTAFGLAVRPVSQTAGKFDRDVVAVANLRDSNVAPANLPAGRLLKRRLARATPTDRSGAAATFEQVAAESKGAPYLGVLKADGDGLGAYLSQMFRGSADLNEYRNLSRELDEFSAGDLDTMLRKEFPNVYTIYSGGDDLLLIGPWNEMFLVADKANRLFTERMKGRPLTLSAGLAIISRRWPIRRAVVAAEEQLELAKTSTANGTPKNQFSALGQIWKWADHSQIMRSAWRLKDWVDGKVCERGWLQKLLDLAEAARKLATETRVSTPQDDSTRRTMSDREQRTGQLASARWHYFVTRNVKKTEQRPLRDWLVPLSRELDAPLSVDARYLPAILRFALLATRSKTDKE